MGKSVVDMIGGAIFDRALEAISDPNVPVSDAAAPSVAKKIEAAIKPIVVNATNDEPWYQSRIFVGLAVAAAGWLGSKIGIVIGANEVHELIGIVATIFEAGGLAYAWYGRVVGSRKAPLGQ